MNLRFWGLRDDADLAVTAIYQFSSSKISTSDKVRSSSFVSKKTLSNCICRRHRDKTVVAVTIIT